MANVTKSDIRTARTELLAAGKYPSRDAIRIQLGNRGSKSTIVKFMREIEAEEHGKEGTHASLSEPLLNTVSLLASTLRKESDEIVSQVETRMQSEIESRDHRIAELQKELADKHDSIISLEESIKAAEQDKAAAYTEIENTQVKLNQSNHNTELASARLKEQLVTIKALETRNEQTREQLIHFRDSQSTLLNAMKSEHETEVAGLRHQVSSLNATISAKQEEITRSQVSLSRAEESLSTLKSALSKSNEQNQQLLPQLRGLQAQLTIQANEIAKLEVKLEHKTHTLDYELTKNESLHNELNTQKADLLFYRRDNITLKRQLKKLEDKGKQDGNPSAD